VRTPTSVGIVGDGPWGAQLARAFAQLPHAHLAAICDERLDARQHAALSQSNRIAFTRDFDALLDDEDLDAIVVATAPRSRHALALAALKAGKHVLIQTPAARTGAQAEELWREAQRRGLCVMAGCTAAFGSAARKLKEFVDTGHFGDIYYLFSNSSCIDNLWQQEESVLPGLGAPEVASLLRLLDDEPIEVSARGEGYVRDGAHDVVFGYLKFATGIVAHLHLSRLDPQRVRRLSVVGSERMAVIDELDVARKLTIHEKRMLPPGGEREDAELLGAVIAPELPTDDPIALECSSFLAAMRSSALVRPLYREIVPVVRVLETLQRSLDHDGVTMPLEAPLPADSSPVVVRLATAR
jgi:predicted dehydrogenase